jgi:hypothetical protein
MVLPWLEAGYEALTIDIKEPFRSNGAVATIADIRQWHYPLRLERPKIIFAFPPCTNLSVSGARWFKEKGLRGLIDGLELVERCREICEGSGAPWMIENPVSTLASYWRKPDFSFHPWEFTKFELSDNFTKKTCLWIGGGFVMPRASVAQGVPTPDNRIHFASPGEARADFRSATPMGFARAVFEANSPKLAQVA